jgi:sec-independent protein translocase protein TatC
MSRRLPVGPRRARPDELLSVTEHLDELRRRLIISVLALVIAFAGMYAVHEDLVELLMRPLPDGEPQLTTLSPTEPFLTTLKVVFWAAIVLALPVWLYQAYAFVIPAVADQPRRIVLAVTSALAGLFAAGVAFGYLIVLPAALRFLTGFGDETFNTQLRAGEYLGFATTMLLASGLLFEVRSQ